MDNLRVLVVGIAEGLRIPFANGLVDKGHAPVAVGIDDMNRRRRVQFVFDELGIGIVWRDEFTERRDQIKDDHNKSAEDGHAMTAITPPDQLPEGGDGHVGFVVACLQVTLFLFRVVLIESRLLFLSGHRLFRSI